MKRFIDSELLKWKNNSRRKPLLFRGARQVGKTWSVKKFGEKHFKNFVFIDLEYNPDYHKIFEGTLDPKKICNEIELMNNTRIISGETLLFIDEIQTFPRAIMSLRYFYEMMPELHVVAAGSLLEFALQDISFPVGRIQMLEMFPLGFIEFLYATNGDNLAKKILNSPQKVPELINKILFEKLKLYFFIGGMPECVKTYKATDSLKEVFKVQAEICQSYIMDFSKYAPYADKNCLSNVFKSIPKNIGKQIKYTNLSDDYSGPTIKKAFNLLNLARILRKVHSVDPSGIPFGASASEKIFKSIFIDIGLTQYLLDLPVDVEYQKKDLLTIYRGAMAEQFIGQELLLATKTNIYYWSRNAKSSTAEVDYLFVNNGKTIPVEVKSGASGRLKSLHLFLEKYINSEAGYVFSQQPYSVLSEKRLTFLPLYYAYSVFGGNDTIS